MKISVVIPVFNKAPYLRACLDSVFAQTCQPSEIIAVDDASTDESAGILRSIGDPRLRVLFLEKNLGPGGAAQCGMDAASGEYILRVDADDIMFPDRFAVQVALLDAYPSVGACSGHVQLMSEPDAIYRVPLEDEDCKARLLFGVALNQQVTAYRRSVLVRHDVRFRDDWPRYGEDWMQHLLLAGVTRFKNLDRPLAYYRTGTNNISQGRDRVADLRSLYRHVFAHFGISLPEDRLDVHLYGIKCFPARVTPRSVQLFRSWLNELEAMNKERGLFDQAALQQQLDKVWNELLYYLPQHGFGPVVQYLKTGANLDRARLYYLLASVMGTMLPGRK